MKARKFLGVILVLFLCAVPLSASAVEFNMQQLLDGASIVVGDKEFFNFRSFDSGASGGASEVLPSQIFVSPVIADGGFGIHYHSAAFVVGPGQTQDTNFFYSVRTLSGADLIVDNTLRGVNYSAINGATIFIIETVTDEFGNEVAVKEIYDIDGRSFFVQRLFAPQDFLNVGKDIALDGGPITGTGAAFISDFHQTFSQKVPEPISLILLGSGLAGAGLVRRLRKPKG